MGEWVGEWVGGWVGLKLEMICGWWMIEGGVGRYGVEQWRDERKESGRGLELGYPRVGS